MFEELVIRWEVNEVSKLTSDLRHSPFHYQQGIPWRLAVCSEQRATDNVNCFGLYLLCNQHSDSELWRVESSWSLRLVRRDSGEEKKDVRKESKYAFSPTEIGWGWSMIEFSKLLKISEGFIKNDTVIVEGRAIITGLYCIKPNPTLDFLQPSPDADNVALKLDDGTLYVCRRYLMWHSPYFATLFTTTCEENNEFEINDVKVDDFNELLQVIFPSERDINEVSYSAVLKLAFRFQIERAIDLVEKFLLRSQKVKAATKILLAEQYGLESLMKKCMNSFTTVHGVKSAPEFSQMSTALKVSLLAKVFELIKTPK